MNRLKIFCLNNTAEVFTTYVSIPDLMSFLNRTGRLKIFSILATKGTRCMFIERTDNPNEIIKKINDFNLVP